MPPSIPEDPPRLIDPVSAATTHAPPSPLTTVTDSETGGLRRRSLMHHHDFRQLWIGDTGSQLGAALGSLAVPYLAVTALKATPFQMGLLSTLSGLGFLVIGLPAGAIVDRRSKRRVMISADLARAALLATLPAAWWLGVLSLAQLLAVATLVGMLTVFFDVSYQSYLPFLVPDQQVVEGNAKLQASQSVSQSAGPALGGLLLKVIGPPVVVLANAGGYLLSAVFLHRIRHRETPAPTAARPPLFTEIGEGLRFVIRHKILRRLIACTGLGNFASSGGGALLVLFMLRDLHLSPLIIGIIDSSAAVGGLVGALLATALARRVGEGPSIVLTAVATVLFAFCNPLSAVLAPVPTLIIGGVLLTAAMVAYNIATVSFRQRLCPPDLLGRMNASARFLVWGTIPLGAMAGGLLGTHIGVLPTLWLFAGLGLLSILPVASGTLWRLKRLPDHDDPGQG
ncbi:Predicted arabinose efflux permease, MFS family [Nakamurella panacisegetis]|uniref:Predicted arabinose efflux permease, MFS family n=1 Tax=Nakamurella panacisegetis TaxID=1090615 RepID=A0A1H0Q541_9ACTN|nr:Predicted arabinose efflux permease, MFS family [Nakamurella panacisegetis]